MANPSLPADVLLQLSKGYDRSIELNSNLLTQHVRKPRDAYKDWSEGVNGSLNRITSFQLGVRLLGALQRLDGEEGPEPDDAHITATLVAEFHMYKLFCHMPLVHNPFLPHFVTAAARIQRMLPSDLIPDAWKARLEIIRLALTSPGVEDGLPERGSRNMEQRSPQSIMENVAGKECKFIELGSFVDMMHRQGLPISTEIMDYLIIEDLSVKAKIKQDGFMQGVANVQVDAGVQEDFFKNLLRRAEEDIRHKRIASQTSNGSFMSQAPPQQQELPQVTPLEAETPTPSKGKAPIPDPFPITSRSSLEQVRQAFALDSTVAGHTLTRLPLDLSSLDLLTNVLTNGFIPHLDTAAVTREYIQHSLRIIERMGNVFSPTSDSGFDGSEQDGEPKGRDEQVRGVKLLVMFMKNLLRKGKLPVQELSFDIEEICVRYLWINEVREFKKMLEGGDMVEQQQETVGLGIGG